MAMQGMDVSRIRIEYPIDLVGEHEPLGREPWGYVQRAVRKREYIPLNGDEIIITEQREDGTAVKTRYRAVVLKPRDGSVEIFSRQAGEPEILEQTKGERTGQCQAAGADPCDDTPLPGCEAYRAKSFRR